MKKKILISLFAILTFVSAGPYAGIGGSFSNADETEIACRASAMGLIGYDFDVVATEIRYSKGLNNDYDSFGLYVRKEIPRTSAYGLLGYGRTVYGDNDYDGIRAGLGFSLKRFDFEVVYRAKEQDTTASIVFKF